MKDKRFYLAEIVKNIRKVDPYRIILFGSYADETFSEDSDLDLLIILDSLEVAQNYEEKMRNKLIVRRNIYELTKHIPVDLVVYTRGEYNIIMKNRTSFFNEIKNKGKVLYEKTN